MGIIGGWTYSRFWLGLVFFEIEFDLETIRYFFDNFEIIVGFDVEVCGDFVIVVLDFEGIVIDMWG